MKKITLFLWAFLCCIAAKAAIGDTFTEEYNGIVMEFRFTDDTGKNVELGCGRTDYNAFYEGNINGNHSNPTGTIHVPQRVKVATNDDYITVVGIGQGAFYNCSGVTEVIFDGYTTGSTTYPSQITYIGNSAFNRCSALTTIDLSRITTIYGSAFTSCTGLTSITIPGTLKTIGSSAFSGCSNLTTITLNSGVQSIGQEAFYGTGITSVSIPASVTTIGGGAFASGKLTSISVASGNTNYSVTNGCLISSANTLVQATINATSIPSTVTSIGAYAFFKNTGLTTLTIPHGFKSIGERAFWNCSNLATVTSNNVTPLTVNNSFSGIASGATLTIPYGTTSSYTSKGWLSSHFTGGISETVQATLAADNKTITYGDALPTYTYQKTVGETVYGTPSLSSTATSNSDAGNHTITITKGSVENNVNLTNGTLTINKAPLTVTARNYTIMKGAALPSFEVDYSGFVKSQTSSVLTTAPIVACSTSSTDTPGTYTLTPSGGGATNYEMNYVTGTLTILDDVFTVNTTEGVAVEYKVLTTTTATVGDGVSMEHVAIDVNTTGPVTIPSTVTYGGQELNVTGISYRAFHNCSKVTIINLPSTITSIGGAAFARCTSLTSFSVPSLVTTIGEGAFQFDNLLATITLNSGLSSIGKEAFSGTALTTVSIPSSVTSIGAGAFGCSTLESITATGNTRYSFREGSLIDNSNALVQATKNTKAIPSGVTSINELAFTYITSLTDIVIPQYVTTIEKDAFNSCSGLRKVTIYAPALTSYGANAFNNTDSELKILVLKDKVDTYKSGWSSYAAKIEPIALTANNDGEGRYWSTYYNPDTNVTLPSGVTVYKAKFGTTNVTLTETGDNSIIKAGEAVVLKKATSGSIELSSAAGAGDGDYTENELIGGNTVATGEIAYTLAKTENGFGFHRFNGASLDPYKAHLEADETTAPEFFGLDGGGTTGICSTVVEETDANWYDLNGQKLQGKPAKKGVYMKNGRKYIVK